MLRKILYAIGCSIFLAKYLTGILWRLGLLAAIFLVGGLQVATYYALAFLVGSLAKWIADVTAIIRFLNRLLGIDDGHRRL